MTHDECPYPYGSDLHWLWGWGERIMEHLCRPGCVPGNLDWMIFRPDRNADDAMMRFGVDFPTVITDLRQKPAATEVAFSGLLASKTERTEFILADHMESLSHSV